MRKFKQIKKKKTTLLFPFQSLVIALTHLSLVQFIHWVSIGLDNGLGMNKRQAII